MLSFHFRTPRSVNGHHQSTAEARTSKGRLYATGAALIRGAHFRYRAVNAACGWLPEFASGAIRGRLYRLAGFNIHTSAAILGNAVLISGMPNFYEKLTVSEGAVVGDHVTINLDADVFLGKNVTIGPRVLIYTGSHKIGFGSNRGKTPVLAKPVRVEDGCWIGLAAVILPGVTVGHGSVVAAGAVVTHDIPPSSFVEGNPARVVRSLPWGDR